MATVTGKIYGSSSGREKWPQKRGDSKVIILRWQYSKLETTVHGLLWVVALGIGTLTSIEKLLNLKFLLTFGQLQLFTGTAVHVDLCFTLSVRITQNVINFEILDYKNCGKVFYSDCLRLDPKPSKFTLAMKLGDITMHVECITPVSSILPASEIVT